MMNINEIKKRIHNWEIFEKFVLIFISVVSVFCMIICGVKTDRTNGVIFIGIVWIIGSQVLVKMFQDEITKLWLEIDEIRQNVDDEG